MLSIYSNPGLTLEIPILILWLLSPVVCALLNLPYLRDNISTIPPASEKYIRLLTRKSWRYFDDFVTENTHYLPPDNYQEKLKIEVAYRTSPTNIGLYMMSAISAYRFGYLTSQSLVQRLTDTVKTLKSLERYEGHFLNWYDIKNISPLMPKYVSTVDSGNLLASFWATEENCKALIEEPLIDTSSLILGINDNLNVFLKTLNNKQAKDISPDLENLSQLAKSFRHSPLHLKEDLETFQLEVKGYIESNKNQTDFPQEAFYWLQQLDKQLNDFLQFYESTMQWINLFERPEAVQIAALHPLGISWRESAVKKFPTLKNLLARNVEGLIPFIGFLQTIPAAKLNDKMSQWIKEFIDQVNHCFSFAESFKANLDFLVKELQEISSDMKMGFLYNSERKLFSIGYNVSDHRLDSSCYDLLASEARLASFISIAKGDVPLEHWWALGRPTTEAFGQIVLQSWGGTMFEYLMPVIWCKNFKDTLLDYACKVAVKCQIAYGNQLGIPWGISESAYSRLDIHNIYQYRAFGVPFLGLKQGLENDFVITPYSSALALMIDPVASIKNLKRLDRNENMSGLYGFYEAIDYSREYNPTGKHGIVIHTYMAHHLGMSISSFCNSLYSGYIQNLFHAHPRVKSLEAILYERPDISDGKVTGRSKEQIFPKLSSSASSAGNSHFETPLTPIPVTHLLSNGNYALMITNSGSGYSKFQNIDITRWRVDATCDHGEVVFSLEMLNAMPFSALPATQQAALDHPML